MCYTCGTEHNVPFSSLTQPALVFRGPAHIETSLRFMRCRRLSQSAASSSWHFSTTPGKAQWKRAVELCEALSSSSFTLSTCFPCSAEKKCATCSAWVGGSLEDCRQLSAQAHNTLSTVCPINSMLGVFARRSSEHNARSRLAVQQRMSSQPLSRGTFQATSLHIQAAVYKLHTHRPQLTTHS